MTAEYIIDDKFEAFLYLHVNSCSPIFWKRLPVLLEMIFGNVINQPGQSVGDANCWATAALRQCGVDALRAGVEEFKDRDSVQPA
jgi:hypothetical protein